MKRQGPSLISATRRDPKRGSHSLRAADPFELVLSHAEGVKRLAPDRAIFKSSTREDKTASVSIARGADGAILIHDFGGDSTADVLAAMGLSLASLYPTRERREMTGADKAELRQHGKMAGWAAALGVLDFESCLVLIAGGDFVAGKPLDADDMKRLTLACKRITDARAVLCPQPMFKPVQS